MLNISHRYLFQLVNQRDGQRSDPFVSDPTDVKLCCTSMSQEERLSVYVLVLMDVDSSEDDDQKIAHRFPLMLVASFLALSFNDNTKVAANG